MKEKKQIALVSVFVGIIWMVYLIVAYESVKFSVSMGKILL